MKESVRQEWPQSSLQEKELKTEISEATNLAAKLGRQLEDKDSIKNVMKNMLNPALMKDPKFLLIGVSNFFGFLGFYVPFMYLPSMAEDRESISGDEAAFLLSIIGIR